MDETRVANVPERVADAIRDLVARGALAPGLQLRQMELAARFQTSRVPLREALKRLAAEGVVAHDPNRGFFVASVSSDEARQLYRVRRLLERDLLESIEWPDARQLARLRALAKELARLLDAQRYLDWASRHREFHRAVFELSPDRFVVNEVLRLWSLGDRYRALLPDPGQGRASGNGAEDERRLIDALAKRDRKRLLRVFEEDRARVEQMLIGLLAARGV